MNFLLERDENSQTSNKNVENSTQVFKLFKNRQRIYLSRIIEGVVGFRVKHLCWGTQPTAFLATPMLMLLCDDLLENGKMQSTVNTPTGPYTSQTFSLPIIASWILEKAGLIVSPNAQQSNYEQPIYWLTRELNLSDISFEFRDADGSPIEFLDSDNVYLVFEFFYNMNRLD
jgi:TM2 domain-containing membrane protein YozV